MSGAGLQAFLLLCVGAATVPRTGAEVKVPASLVAEAELPLLLSCNVTYVPGAKLHQVQWSDPHGKPLLSYQPQDPFTVSHQDDNVQLVASPSDGSSIRIIKLQPDGAGCYRCTFNIFPTGTQEGEACVKVTGRVHPEGNRTALNGQPLTLSCRYSGPGSVRQVLWRKTGGRGDGATTTVAWYAGDSSSTVEQPFQGLVSLSLSLGTSQLTFLQPRAEDEACYTCQFHTFPDGTREAVACLAVFVVPRPQLSRATSPSGDTQVNCTAHSRPPAEITWEVGGANATLALPTLTHRDLGDGTTAVTSALLLRSGTPAWCVVRHPGLQEPLRTALEEEEKGEQGSDMVVILVLCSAAALLVLGLCVCLCKCLCCGRG